MKPAVYAFVAAFLALFVFLLFYGTWFLDLPYYVRLGCAGLCILGTIAALILSHANGDGRMQP